MGTIDRYKYLFVVNDRMKRVIAVHTLFHSQPDGPVHRRMRRGAGGAPQLLGNSVFWAAAVLFLGSSNGGRGVFFNFPEGG